LRLESEQVRNVTDRKTGPKNPYIKEGSYGYRISLWIVHPDYQMKGVGQKVVELMLREYKDYARKMVIAYDETLAFFQKCGFEVGENNVPHVCYVFNGLSTLFTVHYFNFPAWVFGFDY
jgi:GNAT superfamily N-acetyltransferase